MCRTFAVRMSRNFEYKNKQMEGTKHARHVKAKGHETEPKHPGYELLKTRLDSFVDWPRRYVPKTPEELAAAGFFYIGSADRVTCFQCGITLRDWEEEHDPVAEHQRYSEHCQFINKTDLNQLGVATRKPELAQGVSPIEASSNQNTRALTGQVTAATHIESATEGHVGEKETDDAKMGGAGSDNQNRNSNNACASAGAHHEDVKSGSAKEESWASSLVKPLAANEEMTCPINNVTQMFNDSVSLESEERECMTKQGVSQTSEHTCSYIARGLPREKRSGQTTVTALSSPVKTENRKLRAQVTCRLCQTAEVSVVFLPCGHLVTCATCAERVDTCPMCAKIIAGTVKAFMA
ncbi:baculoviral IAP repeat-containing protein 7-like isoform X3 [Haliotis rufescens]|uniref:baculoviral IAP repeat-containing protein 7-like isoform X3 n=2 Tax=Haliotis rufescens TaxID=6454 RepID=UPI00201FA172|nr:baculoviral IAP repeat-containing protein 7-like isoform X3 [Haliotis rufescens]